MSQPPSELEVTREELPHPWVFMEDPFRDDFVPEEIPRPAPRGRRIEVGEVRVDPAKHPTAYRRDWTKTPGAVRRTPWRPPVVPDPLVRATQVTPEHDLWSTLPDAMRKAHADASHSGYLTRATYAQGGAPRARSPLGACGTCTGHVRIYAESAGDLAGRLLDHSKPITRKCTGLFVLDGACSGCGKKVTATKAGPPRSHEPPATACPGGGGEPTLVIPRPPADPIRSVVFKVIGTGVAWWADQANGKWKAEEAYLRRIVRGAPTFTAVPMKVFEAELKKPRGA